MTIKCILKAYVRTYGDTRQCRAYVEYLDTRNHQGRTEGDRLGTHMQALLLRAVREGVNITSERW